MGPAPKEKKLDVGAWKCNFQNFGHQKECLQANQMKVKDLIGSSRPPVIGSYRNPWL